MHTSVTVLLSTLALSAVWVCQAVQPQPHLRSFDAGRFARLTPAKEMARWPGEHLPTKLFMYVRHLVKDKISPSEDSVFTTLERAMGDLELAMNNFACFRDIPRSDVRKVRERWLGRTLPLHETCALILHCCRCCAVVLRGGRVSQQRVLGRHAHHQQQVYPVAQQGVGALGGAQPSAVPVQR